MDNVFTAYYDLRCSPATYDIVAFLCAAEAHRRREAKRRHLDRVEPMQIIMLPGPFGGFRRDDFWPPTIRQREMMRDNVAVPMAKMLGATSIEVSSFRPGEPLQNSIGFGRPMYGLSVQVEAMREGVRPLRAGPPPRQKDRLVTITLREAEHWPERNSNVDAWMQAALAIRTMGFDVIVVRDTERADAAFGDIETSPKASRDLYQRGWLYERAACNMFVNNGPAWFAMALDAHVLMLKPTVEGLTRSCSADYFRECGIEPGIGQIPGAPSYQRIVWQEDEAKSIIAAFDDFIGRYANAA